MPTQRSRDLIETVFVVNERQKVSAIEMISDYYYTIGDDEKRAPYLLISQTQQSASDIRPQLLFMPWKSIMWNDPTT